MLDYWLLPATFLTAFLGNWLIIRQAMSRQWLDTPNDRSSHDIPKPTGGGAAICVVFSLSVLVAFRDTDAGFNHYLVLLLAFGIAALGLADDIYKLGIGPRIGIQAIVTAGALALFGIPPIPVFGMIVDTGWPGLLLALLFMTWFINLFNFMDGIDGLAAAETLFISMAVVLFSLQDGSAGVVQMLLLLMAAVCGFLVLNLAPAKIFMGDTGSNFLGFMLCVAGLAGARYGLFNVWVWLILASVFLVDATYTLIARMAAGETWYYAHRTHAYQLAAMHYSSHGKVVTGVTLINLVWLLPLAWMAKHHPVWGLALTLSAWLPLAILVQQIRKRFLPGQGLVQPS